MPSASTTRPFAESAAIESSLCERTIPGSVQVAISRFCERSAMSELDVDAAGGGGGARRRGGKRGAQRSGELLARLEARLRILRQCRLEEADQPRRHAGVEAADVGRRVVRDLEHELRHRLALEGQPAGQQEEERAGEREGT